MANITWKTTPAWGWGGGAGPATYETVCAAMYPYWEDYTKSFGITDLSSGAGIYMKNVVSSSQGLFSGVMSIKGAVPASAWISLLDANLQPKNATILTLVFPKAKRRVSFFCETTYSGGVYIMNIGERWYDTVTNERVYDVTSSGIGTIGAIDGPLHGEPGCLALNTQDATGAVQYGFGVFNATAEPNRTVLSCYYINIEEYSIWLQAHNPGFEFGTWEVDTTSPEAGEASKGGGYGGGTFALWDSDQIDEDPLPVLDGISVGFVHMYAPGVGDLQDLGSEIFPDFEFNSVVDPTGNDVVNAILNACGAFVDIFNQIPRMFEMFINSRLIDYVQDCHIVPVVPQTSGRAHIKLGFRELDTDAPEVTSEYVRVDCGDLNIREVYGQFLDYSPFTRAKLFLPFVGFVPIEPEYWQNGTLNVTYKFSVRDGSFMCNVKSTPTRQHGMNKSIIGQYSGTACIHIPLTGLNYSSMISGVVGGVAATVPAIASGNPAAAAMAALNTAASAPEVQSSNGFTGSSAFLGQRTPFLIIERTVQHYPQHFAHDVGIPSKITTTLGSAKGFVRVKDVDLSGSNFRASEEEKEEIRKLLAEGIYV